MYIGLRVFKAIINVLAITLLLMTTCKEATAKDLGKWGNSFEIKEEGFLSMINRKLKSVDIEAENNKMLEIGKIRVNEPTPVTGITRAKEYRSFTFDPTYTATSDVTLPCGKVIVTKGTKVNPLRFMEFDRKLFFIDSRDKSQVKWLKAELRDNSKSDNANLEPRVILVGGSPLILGEELEMQIYFDQSGVLTEKFGIRHVPATVIQKNGDKVLTIEEIVY